MSRLSRQSDTSPPTPTALLRTPGGEEVEVGPGGIIGRLSSAALCIDDPRISEAHAMVSLRGGRLVMLALRGRLRKGGNAVTRVELSPGQRIDLVEDMGLDVLDVRLPGRLLGLRVNGHEPEPLVHSVYSLRGDRLEPGYSTGAEAHAWAAAEGWRIRLQGESDGRPLRPGVHITLPGGVEVEAVEVSPRAASTEATVSNDRIAPAPLRIVARHETAHLHSADGISVHVPGIAAHIISELIDFDAPVPWEMIARTLWPDKDRYAMRQNWDRNLRALRERLRDAGLRDDLVRPDGCGNIELYLLPGDEVLDQR